MFKGDSGSAFSKYSSGRTRRLLRLACLSATPAVGEFKGQSVPSEEMLGLEGGSRSVSPGPMARVAESCGAGCRMARFVPLWLTVRVSSAPCSSPVRAD